MLSRGKKRFTGCYVLYDANNIKLNMKQIVYIVIIDKREKCTIHMRRVRNTFNLVTGSFYGEKAGYVWERSEQEAFIGNHEFIYKMRHKDSLDIETTTYQ